jgi:hypothetical protein
MTRDELILEIANGIREAYPENRELMAEEVDAIVETTIPGIADSLDEVQDEADEEEAASAKG